jgi:hypothetical protein
VNMALRLIIQWKRKKWYQGQEQWIDTNWMDVENARRHFPELLTVKYGCAANNDLRRNSSGR